jgi:hypothetical protein
MHPVPVYVVTVFTFAAVGAPFLRCSPWFCYLRTTAALNYQHTIANLLTAGADAYGHSAILCGLVTLSSHLICQRGADAEHVGSSTVEAITMHAWGAARLCS